MKKTSPCNRENNKKISDYMKDNFKYQAWRFETELQRSPTLLLENYPRLVDTENGNLVR